MLVVQRAREEPILPQMPAPPVQPVDVPRVVKVRATDGLGQRIPLARRGHQVDVIAHQAIAFHPQAEPLGLLAEQRQIDPPVLFGEKDALPVVAALRDVMRTTRYDHSGFTRHAAIIRHRPPKSTEK